MKKPKKTYLVNEKDLATINYTEPQEDLFAGESIINAANKVTDFEQFKKEQEKILQTSNNLLMKDAETINYVDELNLNDVMENKNLKMVAKRISDKYKKIRQKKKSTSSYRKVKNKEIKQHLQLQEKFLKNIEIYMADFEKAKNEFNKLKVDPSSVAFAQEILDKKLLAKLRKL